MKGRRKHCFIFFLIFVFLGSGIFAYNENANGYPSSYDSGLYNRPTPPGGGGGGGNESEGDTPGGDESGENNTGGEENDFHPQGMGNTEGLEIMNEANTLDGLVDGEAAGLDGIATGENLNASEMALASEGDANAGVEVANANAQNEVNANNGQSEGEKNSANSGEAGDPVKISKGTYELSEEDIVIGNDNKFVIKRRYESDCKITGSFGYGWKTNLDERIILGTNPKAHKDLIALNDYLNIVKPLILQLEEKLKEQYRVTSIYNAQEELNERINNCNLHIEKLDEYIAKLEALKNRAHSYYSLAQQIESIIAKALKVKESAINKKELFEKQKKSITQDLQTIKHLKQKLTDAEKEYEKKKKIAEKDRQRHERNKKALFTGMDNYYEETGQNTITVIDDAGYPHILKESQDIWKNEKDFRYKYCKSSGKNLLLYESDGYVKEFDEYGFLIKKTDRNGNYIQLVRDSEERITCILTSDNERFDFEYKNKLITKINNSRCKEECLVYNYTGYNLTNVEDVEGDSVSMEYDSENHITSLKKCDGSFISFAYGEQTAEGNFLTTVTTNEEGYSEYFAYKPVERKTVYTDHDGNQTVYCFDSMHRTIKEYTSNGSSIEYEYDSAGNMVSANTNGNLVQYNYDSMGNKIEALYSDGSAEYWKYDENNQVLEYVDRDGVKEEYVRDLSGNIAEYRKGGETVYEQGFDGKGHLIRKTVYGQKSITTNYSYDDFGNLIKKKCGSLSKEYVYDNRNQIQKIFWNKNLIEEYFYENHSIKKINNSGLETTYLTNGRKDLIKIIQKDSQTEECHVVRVEYDKRHLPVRLYSGDKDKEELIYSFLYTPEGKLLAEILHGGESWIKIYKYQNGMLSEYVQFKTDFDLNDKQENINEKFLNSLRNEADENVYIEKYQYKKASQNRESISVTNGLGLTKLFEYDAYGNLIKQSVNNEEVIEINYSPASRITAEQNLYGGWYEYQYDKNGVVWQIREKNNLSNTTALKREYYPDGSLKTLTDNYGTITRYNYDEMGRISDIHSVNKRIWYQYDYFNRVSKIVNGESPDVANSIYYVEYEYSDDGRTITVSEGGKYKTKYQLDAFGNITKQIYGNENERSYFYNSKNQLIEYRDAYGNKTVYEYNALGKESKMTLPEGLELLYKYNYYGVLEEISDPEGIVYSAFYNKAGQLIGEKSRADCEKKYEYDECGRIKNVWNGNEKIESYEYRNNRRKVTVTDGHGEKYFYEYDSFGRLVKEVNRTGDEQNYYYDAAGQFKNKINFNGYSTSINYSDNRRVKTFSYADASMNVFVYDAAGNIIESENSYGKTLYKYDKGRKLVYQKDVTTGEEIFYEYDDAGNRIRVLSTNKDSVYVYGKNNEVKEIFDNKQRVRVKLSYNKNGQEILRKFGNGTEEETLYDKAGRVIVKTLKSERGNLLWGEGYVYNSAGKRTATIDNSGHVTFYEYNNSGRLSAVYYPYTDEHIAKLKSEAVENGLPDNKDIGENRFLTSSEKASLVPLLNSMQYGLAFNLASIQPCIKESYSYDKNGNRLSKTTAYGTVEYNYNKENCLISSGSRGKAFINYTYDRMGNLLMEESSAKSIKYAYNSQNRMIYYELSDRETGVHAQTSYAYDAFGRRLIVQDRGETALRAVYDGFSFDVIKQGPTYSNGLFTDSSDKGIRWERNGRPTGDRYRYLDDDALEDSNRYFYLEDGSYKDSVSRYSGERVMFYVNGEIAAQTTSDYGADYFSTDLLGSVRATTDDYSTVKQTYTYDAFGSLLQGTLNGTLDYGYVAKQQDPKTLFYNYGYRDYNPTTSRFTTQDPIRDGNNWFVYCNGDPVNFVDIDGLFFYGVDGQHSITEIKKTTVEIIRNDNGLGNSFDSTRYIYKNDGINTKLVYVDTVGANCKAEYNGTKGSTTPDGNYYLTNQGTDTTPLYLQTNGTTNSTSFKNTLSLRTNDQRLSQEQRDTINSGDRLFHADETYNTTTGTTTPYNSTNTPGGAGCVVDHTQEHHDEMMAVLMDGVNNPESIVVNIRSFKQIQGCGK